MKVLMNGLQIGENNGGVQYYSEHLYKAIQNTQQNKIEIQLYTESSVACKNKPFSLFQPCLSLQKNRLSRILIENLLLPQYLKHQEVNVCHSPNYVLPYFLRTSSIITIHDLITFDFPELCRKESVAYFKLLIPRSIKQSDKIIIVSKTVKKDVVFRFGVAKNKISVIPLGISSVYKPTLNESTLLKHSISDKYILFVGNIEPKKNLVRLIMTFHKLISTNEITHLSVIAGKKAWKYSEVFKTVEFLKLQNKVIFTGYVPEEDLPALYSMSELFVFPSIYEGFGFPPLEAMACEVPVLASKTGALPETTGGNCFMVDPYSIDCIAKGMLKLLTEVDLRRKYIEDGKKWVKRFTWKKTAIKTLEVYIQIGTELR